MPTIVKKKSVVLVAAAMASLLIVAGVSVGQGANASAKPEVLPSKPALTVTLAQPLSENLPLLLKVNGNVAAWQEAVVGPQISGLRLSSVKADVGDNVKRGDVLATLASEAVQADLAQAEAAVLEAEANLQDARSNADRARQVQGTGALSQQQISQYLNTEKASEARLALAKAQRKQQQVRLSHTVITAPDSGVVSARKASLGAVVNGGDELFRLVRQNRLEWRGELIAAELGAIKPGQSVKVLPAGGGELTGKVRVIGPTVDAQTRNALVYVDLPASASLRAGSFARGEIDLGTRTGLTVPQTALVVRDGFQYVFELGANNLVVQRKVQLGRRLADRVELLSGLNANAQIVATGAGFLNDGDLVSVKKPAS